MLCTELVCSDGRGAKETAERRIELAPKVARGAHIALLRIIAAAISG